MNRTCKTLIQALLAGTALTQPCFLRAGELPAGATTVQGSVGIATPSANQMTIQQTTPTAIVNWQSFSVGAGSRVDISQPSASSALLNRVSGSATSTIAGQINANGQVYLINPNGILITPTGSVRAAGFVASTLDIADQDFVAGRRVFRGNGQSAAVTNQGTIEIQRGGYAALLGGRVENTGLIRVPMGRVGLGAGEQAALDLSGDGFLQVALPSKVDGSDMALIQHSGTITAAGGQVVMQAATARNAARNAINLSGIVEAHSVSGRNGAIILGGGDGGSVTVSGRLDTSARTSARASTRPPARGGTITVTADNIQLKGATLLANGQAGGGTISVGGGFKGQGPLQRATITTVDAATTISANAGQTGNGGNVVVWSDHQTNFAGRISATGGAQSGDGGQSEVSGKNILAYTGMTDLSAPKGTFGTLLLDPYNVTISGGSSDTTLSSSSGNGTASFTANGNDSIISSTTILDQLKTANVTISTGNNGNQTGNITVNTPLVWGSSTQGFGATTLTLSASNSIIVNQPLTVNGGGGLALNYNIGRTGGTLSFAPGVSATFNNSSVGNQTQPQTLSINNTPYILVSQDNFGRLFTTSPSPSGSYALVQDLSLPLRQSQPLGAFSGNLEGLGHRVSGLTVDTNAQSAGIFASTGPGSISNIEFDNITVTGRYAGLGPSYVGGLAGQSNGTVISGVTFNGTVTNASTGASVPAASYLGGLIGQATNTTISSAIVNNITAGNTVTPTTVRNQSTGASLAATGGLVGSVIGTSTVQNSRSAAIVTGGSATSTVTGGLIGQNSGTVLQGVSTGNVTGGSATTGYSGSGGLIGQNSGQVSSSNATGDVTGGASPGNGAAGTTSVGSFTGGLIGLNTGSTSQIDQDTASGAVNGANGAAGSTFNSYVGGLIGFSLNAPTRSSATGRVSRGNATNIFSGDLLGYSSVNNITNSNTTPNIPSLTQGSTTPSVSSNAGSTSSGSGGSLLSVSGSSGSSSSGSSSSSNGSSSGSSSSGSSNSSNGNSSGSSSSGSSSSSSDNSSKPASDSASKPASDNAAKPAAAAPAPQNAGNSATPSVALSTLVSVQSASRVLESRFGGCNTTGGSGLPGATNCFGSALDAFADELELQAQQLPPAFRGLPAVIRQAASQVRAARTVTEARAAVRVALVAVRKAISLVRADDSDVGRIQVRQGNAIYTALETADTRLSRAVGL